MTKAAGRPAAGSARRPPCESSLYIYRPKERPSGKAGSLVIGFGRGRKILFVCGFGEFVTLTEPTPQIDRTATLRAKRVLGVSRPFRRHRRVTDRALHLIHRLPPTQTFVLSRTTRISGFTALFPFTAILCRWGWRKGAGCGGFRRFRFGSGRCRGGFIGLRGLRVAIAAVVIRFVKSAALEQDGGTAAEQTPEFLLFALRALLEYGRGEGLPFFEGVLASVADILICGHLKSLGM